MDYRNLGRSGIRVSPICLGTMMFGGPTDEVTANRIVDRARDQGINFIDTANTYTDGESERIVGRAIAAHRDWWILATKLANPTGPGPNNRGTSRIHIMLEVEASLRRLGVETIDILYLHKEDHSSPLDETVGALADLIHQGKIRHFGVSNHRAWRVAELCRLADSAGIGRPVVSQPTYNVLNRVIEAEQLPACAHLGVGVFPYSPLARGLLTGKYQPGVKPAAETRAGRGDGRMLAELSAENFDLAAQFTAHAAARGIPAGRLALAWILANRLVTGLVAGPRTEAQWDDYVAALSERITDEDEALVDRLVASGHPSMRGYNDTHYVLEGRWRRP